jgi:hypothetical protein
MVIDYSSFALCALKNIYCGRMRKIPPQDRNLAGNRALHPTHLPEHLRLPWDEKIYRNPHGRGLRQPSFGWQPPYYATSAGIFEQAALSQIKRLQLAWPELFKNLECAIDDVPPSDPAPWEEKKVVRSRLFPSTHGTPARIVIYRRPLQTRANSLIELQLLIRDELVIQLANLTGKNPEDIDPQVMF